MAFGPVVVRSPSIVQGRDPIDGKTAPSSGVLLGGELGQILLPPFARKNFDPVESQYSPPTVLVERFLGVSYLKLLRIYFDVRMSWLWERWPLNKRFGHQANSPLFELARVLVRLDHIARLLSPSPSG